jgi:SHS2 domain-containing protein
LVSTPFYTVIDHTADLGIEVEAESREGVFTKSALAMFDLMFGLGSIGGDITKPFSVTAENPVELLVAWLNELLYFYAVERILFSGFADVRLGEDSFRAVGCGERFDPGKHRCDLEIKAATYHDVSLAFIEGRWKARVIFDV